MSPAKKAPAKAELWCKGVVGREHTPVVSSARTLGVIGQCGQHGKIYLCVHHVACALCYRVLRYEWQMGKEDCPAATE